MDSSSRQLAQKKLQVWVKSFFCRPFCHPQADLVELRPSSSVHFFVSSFWTGSAMQCSFWGSRSKRSWLRTRTSGAVRPGATQTDPKNFDSKFGWPRTSSTGNPNPELAVPAQHTRGASRRPVDRKEPPRCRAGRSLVPTFVPSGLRDTFATFHPHCPRSFSPCPTPEAAQPTGNALGRAGSAKRKSTSSEASTSDVPFRSSPCFCGGAQSRARAGVRQAGRGTEADAHSRSKDPQCVTHPFYIPSCREVYVGACRTARPSGGQGP
jgi:hypothetical protein